MGLDMYLTKRTVNREEVAYWRKANAIHRWFVENVQNGKDDCGEYPVTRENLRSLVDLCQQVIDSVETVPGKLDAGTAFYPDGRIEHRTIDGQVIAQPGIAHAALPTQAGCFFGSTAYDERYLDKLSYTIAQLTPILNEPGGYYYRASW